MTCVDEIIGTHNTGHAERYLIPALGKHRIDRLRVAHVQQAFDALAEQALETAAANALRRAAIDAARAAWHAGDKTTAAEIHTQITAMPPFRRPINAATIQRIRAVLRAALTDAMRQQLIIVNVASLAKLPSGRSPKPLVWTDARVSAWLCTGAVPSPVMVWTAPQTARFLRRAAKHRLFALYLLIAHYGLRRGEACGLRWADVDLDTGLIEITQQIVQIGWDAEIGDTKTDNGRRTIALTPADVRALRRHRLIAEDEAGTHGGWPDTGLVFTNPDHTALHPATVTSQFHLLAKEAALPPVRLHDVRHGAATHALAAGVEMKVVSDILGHATTAITADIYTSDIDDLKKTAATKIADHIGFNPDDAVEL